MTPDQLAKSGSEAAHQTALFAWAAVARQHGFLTAGNWSQSGDLKQAVSSFGSEPVPELEWFHAVANGGSRGDDAKSRAIRGGQLKAQGVRAGVADTFLPVPRGPWHGLYIEMKKPTEKPKREGSKGGVSDEQSEFGEFVKSQGYGWIVCYSWREAADVLEQYLTYNQS